MISSTSEPGDLELVEVDLISKNARPTEHCERTSMLSADHVSSSVPAQANRVDGAPPTADRVKWQLYFYTIAASFSELANGYDIGAFSFALLYFKEDPHLSLSSLQVALLAGQFNLVAGLGCMLAGPVSDAYGRKASLMGGNLVNVVGTLMLAFSSGFGSMFVGRLVMGLGAGVAFTAPEMYACEMSPPSVRGLTSSFGELFINLGILVGYLCGWVFQPYWRVMVGVGAAIPALAILMQAVIPETPRWLLTKGRDAKAVSSLHASAHFTEERVAEQVAEIKAAIREEEATSAGAVGEMLRPSGALVHAMFVGWGVAFLQQANGSEGVVYFTPTVLKMTGISNDDVLFACTSAVGACKACFVAVALLTMDRLGRVPLLVTSSLGCVAALVALGSATTLPHTAPWVPVAALCLFMTSMSLGWGPLTGVLLPEVFPLRVRGVAVGIGWALNRFASGTVALAFVFMKDNLGVGNTFFVYLVGALLGLWFSWLVVPETKGATLESITHLFERRGKLGVRGIFLREHNVDDANPLSDIANGE